MISETAVTVTQPDRVILMCTAIAKPKPSITWYRVEQNDSRTVISSGTSIDRDYKTVINILTFNLSRPSLSSNYICRAANLVARAESNVSVTVLGKGIDHNVMLLYSLHVYISVSPVVTSQTPSLNQIIVNMGDSVTFECVAIGIPEPSITWYRHGVELNATATHISIISEGITRIYQGEVVPQITSRLTLNWTKDEDSGYYVCTANNTATPGEDRALFQLLVQCEFHL